MSLESTNEANMSKAAVILQRVDEDLQIMDEGKLWDFIKSLFSKPKAEVEDPEITAIRTSILGDSGGRISKEDLSKAMSDGIDIIFDLHRLVKSGKFIDAAEYAKSNVAKLEPVKQAFDNFEKIEKELAAIKSYTGDL